MTAGRPIGERIRSICTVIEQIGPANSQTVRTHIPDVDHPNMLKFCNRAVSHGLLTIERVKRENIYTVVDDWELICGPRHTTMVKKPVRAMPVPTRWQGISSVFQMGA